jgi:hypothetical protein
MVCWAVSLKYKLQSGGEFLYVHPSLMVADSSHPLPLTPHPLPYPPPSPFFSLIVVSSLPSLLLRYRCEFTLSPPFLKDVNTTVYCLILYFLIQSWLQILSSSFSHNCEYYFSLSFMVATTLNHHYLLRS